MIHAIQTDGALEVYDDVVELGTAFGDEALYIEKYFLEPRHIEVQILADERGRTISVGER